MKAIYYKHFVMKLNYKLLLQKCNVAIAILLKK